MRTNIQFINMDSNSYVEDRLLKKINKISKKYDWVLQAEVFYKEDKNSAGKGKICEIRLSVPGPRIFASSNEESIEKATDETLRDLERQLKSRKQEMKPHI